MWHFSRVEKHVIHFADMTVFQDTEVCSGDERTRRIEQLPLNMRWAILMLTGGHFAAAVFNG